VQIIKRIIISKKSVMIKGQQFFFWKKLQQKLAMNKKAQLIYGNPPFYKSAFTPAHGVTLVIALLL